MVDFNNEATIGTPAQDIVRVLVLQARANVFESWELYTKQKLRGMETDKSIVIARLCTWFLEHQAYLKRVTGKKDIHKYEGLINTLLYNGSELPDKKIIEIMLYLNEELDKLRITKLDTKQYYDRSLWENENRAHGL